MQTVADSNLGCGQLPIEVRSQCQEIKEEFRDEKEKIDAVRQRLLEISETLTKRQKELADDQEQLAQREADLARKQEELERRSSQLATQGKEENCPPEPSSPAPPPESSNPSDTTGGEKEDRPSPSHSGTSSTEAPSPPAPAEQARVPPSSEQPPSPAATPPVLAEPPEPLPLGQTTSPITAPTCRSTHHVASFFVREGDRYILRAISDSPTSKEYREDKRFAVLDKEQAQHYFINLLPTPPGSPYLFVLGTPLDATSGLLFQAYCRESLERVANVTIEAKHFGNSTIELHSEVFARRM